MKKLLLLLVTLSLSICSFAQKIEKDEIDEFLGTRKMQTTWVRWFASFSNEVSLRFRSVDDKIYLEIATFDNLFIDKGNSLYLLLDNKDVIELNSMGYYTPQKGGGTTRGRLASAGYGIHALYEGNMEKLKYHIPKKIRVYTSSEYAEYKVKDGQKIRESFNLINNKIIQYYPNKTTEKSEAEKAELDSLLNIQY